MVKKSEMRIESRPWAFQRTINQGRASPLISSKWDSHTQICRFLQQFRPKAIKNPLQSFIVKKLLPASL